MKTLILNRHGKSDWSQSDQTDFERTLNKRGKNDSYFMAKRFTDKKIRIDKIISSSAVRAMSTAKIFAEQLKITNEEIQFEEEIYSSGNSYMKSTALNWNNKWNTVIIFGHNPDFSSLATYYLGEQFYNIPTCGIVCIEFEISSWKELNEENGKLKFFEFPKMFRNDADK